MKAIVISAWVFVACSVSAGDTGDVVAIKAAVSDATEIRATGNGYSITTPSGTRTAYKTPNGYYVEGGGGKPNQQIIKTSTGYRVESSETRGAVFSSSR